MTKAEVVVAVALEEWSKVVKEPPGKGWERIDTYIRASSSLAWLWLTSPYTRNRQFEWCGAFAAHCFGAAGLMRSIRVRRLASTYRLDRWSRGTERRVPSAAKLQPGDIMVVGKGKRYGTHITLVERVDGGNVYTIEGNGHGRLGDGVIGEGVVRRVRPLSHFVYGVRPLPEDFDEQ